METLNENERATEAKGENLFYLLPSCSLFTFLVDSLLSSSSLIPSLPLLNESYQLNLFCHLLLFRSPLSLFGLPQTTVFKHLIEEHFCLWKTFKCQVFYFFNSSSKDIFLLWARFCLVLKGLRLQLCSKICVRWIRFALGCCKDSVRDSVVVGLFAYIIENPSVYQMTTWGWVICIDPTK